MSRVLLADDNLTVQRMVAAVLRGEGMSVTVVDSGPAALDSVRNDPPDLILTDFDLEGMNVAAFANRARKDARTSHPIPIIALMSPNDSCDNDRLSAMGIQAAIKKPIDSDLLRQAVNQWMPTPSAETVLLNGHSRSFFHRLMDLGRSLSPLQPTHHGESTSALRLNETGKPAPSLADPSSPMAQADIPAMMPLERMALAKRSEDTPIDPIPPNVDLSPAMGSAHFNMPNPILSADIPKAEQGALPSDIAVSEKASPVVPERVDLSPVFCPIVVPLVAEAVDATPKVNAVEVTAPPPTETVSVSCAMPPASTPPAPEIPAEDLRAVVETEIAARLPEMIRAILTPEMVQTALATAMREVVLPMAETQLPKIIRTILTPEIAQAALANVAREVIPPIAEAEIIKEIKRLEPKVS